MDVNAEVAQPGRALDSLLFCSGGEAEDRVVAGSNPALGTTMVFWHKPATLYFPFLKYLRSMAASVIMNMNNGRMRNDGNSGIRFVFGT